MPLMKPSKTVAKEPVKKKKKKPFLMRLFDKTETASKIKKRKSALEEAAGN